MSIAPQCMTNASQTLPTDRLRQILWRFSDRVGLQNLVKSVRDVARGPVARLVASGARSTHEWTPGKSELLEIFDRSGITAAFMGEQSEADEEESRNLARALIAFELAWVDAGAATSLLAGLLALAPICSHGTPEQRQRYFRPATSPPSGVRRKPWRGAFCLTEPIPYAGTDASILGGKMRIADWDPGKEPTLQVKKNGRYITNMGFANFVVAAVESDDARIRGSCLVILEEGDPGMYDRGIPTRKIAHQLSSTSDPKFDLMVPASRILGGYTVQDDAIVPNFSHGELIEPLLKRSRVTVGLLTSAKLLSAVEPLIRYHRERFRGAEHATPGTPRYEVGLQQHQDVVHRLVEIWAAGEAGASLGFAAARLFDLLDPVERQANAILEGKGIVGRGKLRAHRAITKNAIDFLKKEKPSAPVLDSRLSESKDDALLQFVLLQAEAILLAPAVKLWNTGVGATMMREALSLIGGLGVTEDCPGFLGYKWIDAQLEATYEGPEALQRRSLVAAMSNELFPALWKKWTDEMHGFGVRRAGARSVAAGMELWFWTYTFLQQSKDDDGGKRFRNHHQEVTFPLADALCWLLAARQFVLDVDELANKTSYAQAIPGNASDTVRFYDDLCHVQSGRTAGEAARICAELAFGHCTSVDERADKNLVAAGSMGDFLDLRAKLDVCLAGLQLAKRRAAQALSTVTIPEALDYPSSL